MGERMPRQSGVEQMFSMVPEVKEQQEEEARKAVQTAEQQARERELALGEAKYREREFLEAADVFLGLMQEQGFPASKKLSVVGPTQKGLLRSILAKVPEGPLGSEFLGFKRSDFGGSYPVWGVRGYELWHYQFENMTFAQADPVSGSTHGRTEVRYVWLLEGGEIVKGSKSGISWMSEGNNIIEDNKKFDQTLFEPPSWYSPESLKQGNNGQLPHAGYEQGLKSMSAYLAQAGIEV